MTQTVFLGGPNYGTANRSRKTVPAARSAPPRHRRRGPAFGSDAPPDPLGRAKAGPKTWRPRAFLCCREQENLTPAIRRQPSVADSDRGSQIFLFATAEER